MKCVVISIENKINEKCAAIENTLHIMKEQSDTNRQQITREIQAIRNYTTIPVESTPNLETPRFPTRHRNLNQSRNTGDIGPSEGRRDSCFNNERGIPPHLQPNTNTRERMLSEATSIRDKLTADEQRQLRKDFPTTKD